MSENRWGLVYDGSIIENVPGQVNIHPVSYKANGVGIAANIYTPADWSETGDKKYPAVTVAHPNGGGQPPVKCLLDLVDFDARHNMELINVPLLMMAGSLADTLYMTEDCFELAAGTQEKELFIVEGARHIQTYFVPEYVEQETAKLLEFFGNHL